jgi:nitroimidazol reductase NimA-like FMN-containing flavoprotein (pyridoxamine 5'-phosphate oxidase superfamily)
VTIWFMVDGDAVYLATANASRQWVRNVKANPEVSFDVADQTFSGTAEPVHDAAEERHVMESGRREILVPRAARRARPPLRLRPEARRELSRAAGLALHR